MNGSKGLPIGEAIQFGWDTFKANVGLLLAVQVAAILAEGVVNAAMEWWERFGGFHEYAMAIAHLVVTMIIQLGFVKISLKFRDGEKVEFANMFDSFNVLAQFLIAGVLVGLAVAFGLIFLIVPGIIIAIRFLFTGYTIYDEERGPIEGIQRSIELTRGYGFDLFLFGMLLFGINLLGVICLGIGVFVSGPVTLLAIAHVYRHLNPKPAGEVAGVAQPTQ